MPKPGYVRCLGGLMTAVSVNVINNYD